jgi:hypothetical protein
MLMHIYCLFISHSFGFNKKIFVSAIFYLAEIAVTAESLPSLT